jgi:large repetitive protein
MVSGTDTAPIPEHSPPLVQHYYEYGGWQMTSEEASAYARSAEAFDGAMCASCQASQGGQLSWYSRGMRELFGL